MSEPREEKLTIRLSRQEKEAVRQAAASAYREVSDYARRKLLRGLRVEEVSHEA